MSSMSYVALFCSFLLLINAQQQVPAEHIAATSPFADVFPMSVVVTETSTLEFTSETKFNLPPDLDGKIPATNRYDLKISNDRDVELLSWNSDHKPVMNLTYNALSLVSHLGSSSQPEPSVPVEEHKRYHLDCTNRNIVLTDASQDLRDWLKNTCASVSNSDAIGKFLAGLQTSQSLTGGPISVPDEVSLLPIDPQFGSLANAKVSFIRTTDSGLTEFNLTGDFKMAGVQQNSYSTLKGELTVDLMSRKYQILMKGSSSGSITLPDGKTVVPMVSSLSVSAVGTWQQKPLA